MKRITFILSITIVIIILGIISSRPNNKEHRVCYNPNAMHVNFLEEKVENVAYSELFSKVRVVPLETTSEGMIGNISSVQIVNDTIYVFDKSIAKSLFIFNLNGKYIRKISRIGKAPGEYIYPNIININNGTVSILDSKLQKMIKYDLQGNFKEEFFFTKEKVTVKYAIPLNNLYIVEIDNYKTKNPDQILKVIDNKSNTLNSWFHYPEFNKGWNNPTNFNKTCFYKYDQSLRYYNFFNDTIYIVSDTSVSPYVIMENQNPLTANDVKEFNESKNKGGRSSLMSIMSMNKAFGIRDYLENSSYIYFWYSKGKMSYTVLIDKSTNVSRICILKDDLLNTKYTHVFDACTNEFFVQHFSRWEAIEQLKKKVKNGEVKLSEDDINNLIKVEMQDNPVLFFYTLK